VCIHCYLGARAPPTGPSLPFRPFLSRSHSHSSDTISAIRFLHGGSILRAYSAPHCATYLIYRFLFFRTPCRLLRTNVRGHKPQGGSFGYVALYDFNPRIVNRSVLIYMPRLSRLPRERVRQQRLVKRVDIPQPNERAGEIPTRCFDRELSINF